tara:strand:- start:1624 stop:1797 length:174 start_codon:yes stop_codon:yes gene_type:complete
MTTLTNTSGSKKVNISSNDSIFRAMYVQIYNGSEQVLESKSCNSFKMAEKWAIKKLS